MCSPTSAATCPPRRARPARYRRDPLRHDDLQRQRQRYAGTAGHTRRRGRLGRLSRDASPRRLGHRPRRHAQRLGNAAWVEPQFRRRAIFPTQRRRRRRWIHESGSYLNGLVYRDHEAVLRLRDATHATADARVADESCSPAPVGMAKKRTSGTADDNVYLFTSFRDNGEDGLRFLSSDGRLPLEGSARPTSQAARRPEPVDARSEPVARAGRHVSPRLDHRLEKDQGFGYASSKDLVHWSAQQFIPVMEHEPTTVNVWAPELFYDEPKEQFIICWASTIPGRFPDHEEPHDNNQRMYYTTTRDFKTFTPAKLFFDPGFNVIDCDDRQGRRSVCARAQGQLAAGARFARRVWRHVRSVPGTTFRRRLPRISRKARACSSSATTGSSIMTPIATDILRGRQDSRFQVVYRYHEGSLVSQGPQARDGAACARGRSSTICCESAATVPDGDRRSKPVVTP